MKAAKKKAEQIDHLQHRLPRHLKGKVAEKDNKVKIQRKE